MSGKYMLTLVTCNVEEAHHSLLIKVAGFTIMIYELFLTFEAEFPIVWKAQRWSYPKVAYILNRYGGIGLNLYYLYCEIPKFIFQNYVILRKPSVLLPGLHSNLWVRVPSLLIESILTRLSKPLSFLICTFCVSEIVKPHVQVQDLWDGNSNRRGDT